MVIAYHLFRAEEKFLSSGRMLPDSAAFGAAGVDLFFVISGFVMVWTTSRSRPSPGPFLAKRALRIFPLYWLYTAVVYTVFMLRPEWVNSSQGGQFSLVHSLLLLPHDRLPLLMVGWSLVYEVYFYLVFSLLLFWNFRFQTTALALWLFALVSANYFLAATPSADASPLLRLLISPMAIEFIFGCVAAHAVISGAPQKLSRVLIALSVLSFSAVPFFFSPETSYALNWSRVFAFGPPAFLLVLGASLSEQARGGWHLPLLKRIGDCSYSLYLCHLLVLSAGARLAQMFVGDSVPRVVTLLGLFLITILAGELSYRFVESTLMRLTRGKSLKIDRADLHSSKRGGNRNGVGDEEPSPGFSLM